MPALVSVDLMEIAVFGEGLPENRPKLPLHLGHAKCREWIVGKQETEMRIWADNFGLPRFSPKKGDKRQSAIPTLSREARFDKLLTLFAGVVNSA